MDTLSAQFWGGAGFVNERTPHISRKGETYYRIGIVRKGGLLHQLTLLLRRIQAVKLVLTYQDPLVLVWVVREDVEVYLEFYLAVKQLLQEAAKSYPDIVREIQ